MAAGVATTGGWAATGADVDAGIWGGTEADDADTSIGPTMDGTEATMDSCTGISPDGCSLGTW
ncbi:MAG: hypothetical protein IJT83_13975 [Victivallales bacterium]|nr:hypothetical protein [Victivallales bacterium]